MSASEAAETRRGREEQFLTFHLGDEVYGIEVLRVKEILQYSGITKVPRTPPYIQGVINLRGSVVPVVDLLHLFAEASVSVGRKTCVIIVEVRSQAQEGGIEAGIIVDAVDQVLNVNTTSIEAAPGFGTKAGPKFIRGMAPRNAASDAAESSGDEAGGDADRHKDEGFVILLDLDKILVPEHLQALGDANAVSQD